MIKHAKKTTQGINSTPRLTKLLREISGFHANFPGTIRYCKAHNNRDLQCNLAISTTTFNKIKTKIQH